MHTLLISVTEQVGLSLAYGAHVIYLLPNASQSHAILLQNTFTSEALTMNPDQTAQE